MTFPGQKRGKKDIRDRYREFKNTKRRLKNHKI